MSFQNHRKSSKDTAGGLPLPAAPGAGCVFPSICHTILLTIWIHSLQLETRINLTHKNPIPKSYLACNITAYSSCTTFTHFVSAYIIPQSKQTDNSPGGLPLTAAPGSTLFCSLTMLLTDNISVPLLIACINLSRYDHLQNQMTFQDNQNS